HLVDALLPLGFEFLGPVEGPNASGITTFSHPGVETAKLFRSLEENKVVASLRFDREDRQYIRISPHFYNTIGELDTVIRVLRAAL
ncbi:MAG: aminotransferase class V-fold PLP-dependent enzyme, partial [Verrucomicrobiota bacterium]